MTRVETSRSFMDSEHGVSSFLGSCKFPSLQQLCSRSMENKSYFMAAVEIEMEACVEIEILPLRLRGAKIKETRQ